MTCKFSKNNLYTDIETKYQYDSYDNLIYTKDSTGKYEMRKYDENNRLIIKVDNKYIRYYIYDEKNRQVEYFNTTYPDLENPKDNENFIDPEIAIVEFIGVTHYNKRTWLAILIGDGSGIIYKDASDNPNLGSYKNENSNTYYTGDESEICMAYR